MRAGLMRSGLLAVLIGLVSVQIACSPKVQRSEAPVTKEVPRQTPVAVELGEGEERPQRIILFIGDGMGLNAVAASSYAAGEPLAMMEMPHFGMVTTHEYEFVTTDSAAAATAIATGYKTHFEGVSVKPGTPRKREEDRENHLLTLIDAAKQAGWRTGLVSTTRINHATPGAFAAHRHHRAQYDDIALDMSGYGVDVLLGGGSRFFNQREDERDLFDEMAAQGYAVATSGAEVEALSPKASKLVGLTHPSDMPFIGAGDREMELEEMVDRAIYLLDRPGEEEGFFLMVEGSLIDWGGHEMNASRVVSETLDMDRALRRALEYASGREDTLVVVTADHETGALDLLDERIAGAYLEFLGGMDGVSDLTIPAEISGEERAAVPLPVAHFPLKDDSLFGPSEGGEQVMLTSFGFFSAASRLFWDGKRRFSASHTPEMVPVFAQGPGGRHITSVVDNTDLGRQLGAWMIAKGAQSEDGGRSFSESPGEEGPKNTILILADGLGLSALSAAYYHFGELATLTMSDRAFVATHSLDGLVGDRASAATAIATGRRTRRGALGMAPSIAGSELEVVPSLLAGAGQAGKKTGLITQGALNGPLPAAFIAHRESVQDLSAEEALEELIALADRSRRPFGLDFIAIGHDEGDLLAESQELRAQGYLVEDHVEGAAAHGPALRVGQSKGGGAGFKLSAQIEEATKRLAGTDEGFLLVVLASELGEKMRQLERGPDLLEELQEMDQAVAAALTFAEEDGETLVLVTSAQDHPLSVIDNHYGFHSGRCGIAVECGGDYEVRWHPVATDKIYRGEGLNDAELQGEFGPPRIALQYAWLLQAAERAGYEGPGQGAANFVPLFAQGPKAAVFDGFWDQPRLGQWLLEWSGARSAEER